AEVFAPKFDEGVQCAAFGVFLAHLVHAFDWVFLAERDERAAHYFRPSAVAAQWSADLRSTGSDVGAFDGDRGGDVGAAVVEHALDGMEVELAQFWPLDLRVEVCNQPATCHVAGQRDVVAGAEQYTAPLALRGFALAQDADADERPLGDLA